jgi:RimJ/RimL family protein N-acetyltransferase
MSRLTTANSRPCLPRTFSGKNGLPVDLRQLAADDGQRLVDMYLAFQPRNSFQGLPPIKDDICIRWVREMLVTGTHVIATCLSAKEESLIGHAAIFPVNDKKCEMLVVVCLEFQNLGIGTQLVRSCIELAGDLGYERIWLPVDATNVRARHVYCKCGFEYLSESQGRELDMACDVRAHRFKNIHDLHIAGPRVPAPYFHFPSLTPLVEEK